MSQMLKYLTDMDLKREIDCFLLDLDGTIYIGNSVIDGAREAVRRMQRDKRTIFLTNNSSATREFYVKKLCNMGFRATKEDVYTSANATEHYLLENAPDAKLYILASPEVTEEFGEAGLDVDSADPDTVVLTFDKTLTFAKLARAVELISGGAKYIATHPDMTCPIENGFLPDIGSFIRLIEGATGRSPDIICGKPYAIMAKSLSDFTGVPLSKTAMVGDRLSTDMKFARDNGLKAVLTLTGEATESDYDKSGLKVDKIINTIAEWDK